MDPLLLLSFNWYEWLLGFSISLICHIAWICIFEMSRKTIVSVPGQTVGRWPIQTDDMIRTAGVERYAITIISCSGTTKWLKWPQSVIFLSDKTVTKTLQNTLTAINYIVLHHKLRKDLWKSSEAKRVDWKMCF